MYRIHNVHAHNPKPLPTVHITFQRSAVKNSQILQRSPHKKTAQIFVHLPTYQKKNFATNANQPLTKKPTFWESFKKKKAEYVVKYGASFILVHELLGISSYLIVYQLLSSHIIEITTFTNWFGWSEEDLKSKGIDPSSKLITFAMTVVIVKGLDVMGLVPIRWGLSILLSPLVARVLGPIIDPWFASARKFFGKNKQSIQ